MSIQAYRIDVTLPIRGWTEKDVDTEKCKACCDSLIDSLTEEAKKCEHLGNCLVIPGVEVLHFCKSMLDAAKLRDVQLTSVAANKKQVCFSFATPNEYQIDKYYYNLVYLLAQNGILAMKKSALKRK